MAKTSASVAKTTATGTKKAAAATEKKSAESKAKAAPKKRTAGKGRPAVPETQRRHYVEVAAYYIAERRGFAEGDPLADWAAAEAEIDRLLAAGLLNP